MLGKTCFTSYADDNIQHRAQESTTEVVESLEEI